MSSLGLLCKSSSSLNNPIKTTDTFCDCDKKYFYDFTNACGKNIFLLNLICKIILFYDYFILVLKKGNNASCNSDYECNDSIGLKCIGYKCLLITN